MKDVNKKADIDELQAQKNEVVEALQRLKTVPGYDEYVSTLKDLFKDILHRYYNVNMTTPNALHMVTYYQGQLDLIKRVCSISYDAVLKEITNEQLDEPAG